MKRREFIKTSAVKTISALAGASIFLKACHTEEDMIGEPNWIVESRFDSPLTVPSFVSGNIRLSAGLNSATILKGKTTNTFSYGDGILGPIIKVNREQTVNINFQNDLPEESNIHWHGLVLPENMDGHPHDVAAPGGSLNYELPINQAIQLTARHLKWSVLMKPLKQALRKSGNLIIWRVMKFIRCTYMVFSSRYWKEWAEEMK